MYSRRMRAVRCSGRRGGVFARGMSVQGVSAEGEGCLPRRRGIYQRYYHTSVPMLLNGKVVGCEKKVITHWDRVTTQPSCLLWSCDLLLANFSPKFKIGMKILLSHWLRVVTSHISLPKLRFLVENAKEGKMEI